MKKDKPTAADLIWNLTENSRTWLARYNRSRYSKYYSVIDNKTEIPIQVAAYELIRDRYLLPDNTVLDVGFGLGYGMNLISKKASQVAGIEVDKKAINRFRRINDNPKIIDVRYYDGYNIPYPKKSFDLVTCIDVIEHVKDYLLLLENMCVIARKYVAISTPNRRAEYTNADGSPQNPWHLREWDFLEFDKILRDCRYRYEWHFLDGPWNGPFEINNTASYDTMALVPVIVVN